MGISSIFTINKEKLLFSEIFLFGDSELKALVLREELPSFTHSVEAKQT